MHDEYPHVEILETDSKEVKEAKLQQNSINLKARMNLTKQAKERDAAERKAKRAAYLKRDYTFDEMFAQSCARVYYMKSNKHQTKPTSPEWELPKIADKLLSRFKYNKKQADMNEALLRAAMRMKNQDLIDEYKELADKYLSKCLHSHYGIGVLYGEFLDGIMG